MSLLRRLNLILYYTQAEKCIGSHDTGHHFLYNPVSREDETGMPLQSTAKRSPEPSKTRTNNDWIMIILGIFLVLFFSIAGYFSFIETPSEVQSKARGPVKDPKAVRPEASVQGKSVPDSTSERTVWQGIGGEAQQPR
jgi:hypothetical protein